MKLYSRKVHIFYENSTENIYSDADGKFHHCLKSKIIRCSETLPEIISGRISVVSFDVEMPIIPDEKTNIEAIYIAYTLSDYIGKHSVFHNSMRILGAFKSSEKAQDCIEQNILKPESTTHIEKICILNWQK